jgi:MFS family permease
MQHAEQRQTDAEKVRALPWALANGVLNTVFVLWTFSGSVFLLFLDELGLPKGQIGIILSLFPFCGLLALGFAPMAARLGWKRVFLWGFGTRKVVMAGLLLLPWLLHHAGFGMAVVWLFAVIIIFAVLRAMAETAWYPWEQQYIPDGIRGKYAGANSLLCTLMSVAALFIAGAVIARGTGLTPYLVLLAAGCVLGLLGVAAMAWVPGGEPIRDPAAPHAHLANMLQALRDRNFVAYLGGLGAVTFGTVIFASFLPLYVKEQLGVSAGLVVTLGTAGAVGSAASSLCWGWAADRVGSRPVLMSALGLSLLIPLGWLLLPREVPQAAAWCGALFFAAGATASGVGIAANRLLFNGVVPREHSTAYTALFYAWLGLVGGTAPLLAGGLLTAGAGWHSRIGPIVADGYALLFALALVLTAAGWWCYGRVRPDDRFTTRMVLRRLGQKVMRGRHAGVGEDQE